MRYGTRGVPPNREFVVEFMSVPYLYHRDTLNTFQYVLYEGTNDIQVNYQDVTSFGEETIAGIENAKGTVGLQYPRMDTAGRYRNFYVRYTLNQAEPPIVTTGEADSLTANSVILNGMVNPNGVSTVSYFEYGTTAEYGFATASRSRGSGTDDVNVSTNIGELTPNTLYHYRLVAVSGAGTTYGDDHTFTTSVMSISTVLYFPRINTGNVEGWETEICVINTTTQNVNGVFRAYSNTGVLVSEIDDVILNPKGRRQIIVGDEFPDPADIGYIVFDPDSGPVVGYMKFFVEGYYRAALPAISSINTDDIYISHIASDSKWWTEISILNTTSSAKDLTIEFDNGDTRTVNLSGKGQSVFFISDLFDGEPQDDIQSAVIRDADGVVGLELFNEADDKMSGVLLNGETSNEIYYPHIAGKDGWGTGIVAYNPSSVAMNIVVYPYDDEGNPYESKKVLLFGKQKYIGSLSALEIPDGAAWLRIWAPLPITGFELFARPNLLAGYTGVGISGKEAIFPKLEDKGATGIAFVNVGDGTANILLSAIDDDGNVIATETINLSSHAKVVGKAPDLFSQDISGATYITYSSDMDVVGFQLNASSDGMMLDALPGMAISINTD